MDHVPFKERDPPNVRFHANWWKGIRSRMPGQVVHPETMLPLTWLLLGTFHIFAYCGLVRRPPLNCYQPSIEKSRTFMSPLTPGRFFLLQFFEPWPLKCFRSFFCFASMGGWFTAGLSSFFLRVDSPFFSTLVLFNHRLFSLSFQRFSRKKDPWKDWGRYPYIFRGTQWTTTMFGVPPPFRHVDRVGLFF